MFVTVLTETRIDRKRICRGLPVRENRKAEGAGLELI
jgi:hypothetical protein